MLAKEAELAVAFPEYFNPRCAPTSPRGALALLQDPKPGTCVIFPSFVPHFVTPVQAPPGGAANDRTKTTTASPFALPLRVSVAFNTPATR